MTHYILKRLARLILLSVTSLTLSTLTAEAQPISMPTKSLTPAELMASMQAPSKAWLPIGGDNFHNWTGLHPTSGNPGAAALPVPGAAVFHAPAGPRGFYFTGFRLDNDSTVDCYHWYGLQFGLCLPSDAPVSTTVTLTVPPQHYGNQTLVQFKRGASYTVTVAGKGWHQITLPWSAFDFDHGAPVFLKYIGKIEIAVSAGYKDAAPVLLRSVRLTQASGVALDCDVRSEPAEPGGEVSYPVTVFNCTNQPQSVALSFSKHGWEAMTTSVSPSVLYLGPGQSAPCTVTVSVPATIPPGGHEIQTLVATPNGDSSLSSSLQFTTLSKLTAPYLSLTKDEWQGVRDKVQKYEWAKEALADYEKQADGWNVPTAHQGMRVHPDTGAVPLFDTTNENPLLACSISWQVTRDPKYAEKAALFLLRLCDPKTGYPSQLQSSNQQSVHEGQFFRSVARSYDMIQDAGVLTTKDQANIRLTFRLLIGVMDEILANGGVSNWSSYENSGGFFCAAALQDMDRMNRFVYGPSGMIDQLCGGTMDDGWWYEGATGYNLGVARDFAQLAIAERPFGIDLKDASFPAYYTPKVDLRPFQTEHAWGMYSDKWGPIVHNSVKFQELYDCVLTQPDYRGILYGTGDGHEERFGGANFEIAYFLYRDPNFAGVIERAGGKRDLLYGVPDLPTDTKEFFRDSTYSDNIGLAVMRSKSAGKPDRERIQAVIKYGSHGAAHGHFDRASLVSLMRYGRSFYNPEASWFGYFSPMYKMWMQVPLSHNMVVVDKKMQEPTASRKLMYSAGDMMQAVAVETNTRWSYPPFGGGTDLNTFHLEEPYFHFSKVTNPPGFGDISGYTPDKVLQRRLMVVTDDYVVLADYLSAPQTHTFDNVMQLRGAQLLDSPRKTFLGHEAQFDTDPLNSGQFITNCDRYGITAPAMIHSEHYFSELAPDGNNAPHGNWGSGSTHASVYNDPGVLKIDEHIAWPQQAQVVIGDYAENWNVNKLLTYRIEGDGKALTSGKFGAWILGSGSVDVDVTGIKSLRLVTHSDPESGTKLRTIFWANTRIVTADGKEIPLDQLKALSDNIDPGQGPGKDYAGGPVRIAGIGYDHAVPADPADVAKDGTITLELTGLNAVRLKGIVGGDWPVGDEGQVRKVCAVETTGKQAQFLTVLEPYEDKAVVQSVVAESADKVIVTLTDGRVQEIDISGLEGDGEHVLVTMTETKSGQAVRTETTAGK